MSVRAPLSLLLFALILPACSGDDDPVGPGDTDSSMTATVDGTAWSADTVVALNNGFLFSIQGTANGIEIGLSVDLTQNTLPGTVDLTTGSTGAQIEEGSEVWYAVGLGGSGTLTVQTLSAQGATGTFTMTAAGVGGSGEGTRTITSGSFDVTF